METMKGILHNVGEKKTFNSNAIKKDFIITRLTGGPYPNVIFEAFGEDMISKLDAIPVNSMVIVDFEIHGKSFTGKDGVPRHFNTLRAINITLDSNDSEKDASETSAPKADEKVEAESAN